MRKTALPEPVAPRDAASLIVWRETPAGGLELLMGLRGARHRFMPNRLVFPGGALDEADLTAACASPLPTQDAEKLRRAASPERAAALGIAAARELEEETGLSLGVPPELDGLSYLCRLITPPDSPVRFDCRFFAVDAARVRGRIAGSGEIEQIRFYRLEEALSAKLADPTRKVIERLLDWRAMTEAERRTELLVPVFRDRWAWE